jgi:hypothetical protein
MRSPESFLNVLTAAHIRTRREVTMSEREIGKERDNTGIFVATSGDGMVGVLFP